MRNSFKGSYRLLLNYEPSQTECKASLSCRSQIVNVAAVVRSLNMSDTTKPGWLSEIRSLTCKVRSSLPAKLAALKYTSLPRTFSQQSLLIVVYDYEGLLGEKLHVSFNDLYGNVKEQ